MINLDGKSFALTFIKYILGLKFIRGLLKRFNLQKPSFISKDEKKQYLKLQRRLLIYSKQISKIIREVN